MTVPKEKVICFIDGFNLYHAIKKCNRPEWLWLDLWALTEHFVDPTRENLVEVRYYSALATHRTKHAVQRHNVYMRALAEYGVSSHLGRFKRKNKYCRKCKRSYKGYEEKETDVNLAVDLTMFLLLKQASTALLISNDSDFASTVESLMHASASSSPPGLRVRVITPPRRAFSRELKKASGRDSSKIKDVHLDRSQLPDIVQTANSGSIKRPRKWSAR